MIWLNGTNIQFFIAYDKKFIEMNQKEVGTQYLSKYSDKVRLIPLSIAMFDFLIPQIFLLN